VKQFFTVSTLHGGLGHILHSEHARQSDTCSSWLSHVALVRHIYICACWMA
jgi:hypothetical protein